MEGSNTLFCSSKFPWVRERISSRFIDILDTRPQTYSPALVWSYFSPRKNKWPRHTEVPSKWTPTPRHCTTPSRPVSQFRWLLHRPKTKRRIVPQQVLVGLYQGLYLLQQEMFSKWIYSRVGWNCHWWQGHRLIFKFFLCLNITPWRYVSRDGYHTFLILTASRSDHFSSTEKPRTRWVEGCVVEEPVRGNGEEESCCHWSSVAH
jgi:hypothetical protein